MTLSIQKEIPAIIILTVLLCLFFVLCAWSMKKYIKAGNYQEAPKGLAFIGLWIVDVINNMVSETMGERHVKSFGPYVGSLAAYILVANLSGLFGFNTPTCNLSVTLALALITWTLIEFNSWKNNGFVNRIKGLFEPMPFFVIGNVLGIFAPLLSMSLRLFGNLLSGTIIMGLVYSACASLMNFILGLFGASSAFNLVGVIIAPVLHAYFDVFSGFIQMYIFISLTMILVSNEMEGD